MFLLPVHGIDNDVARECLVGTVAEVGKRQVDLPVSHTGIHPFSGKEHAIVLTVVGFDTQGQIENIADTKSKAFFIMELFCFIII